MPLTLPAIPRRRFLVGSAAGVAALATTAWAAEKVDPNRFALLADTHVPSDPKTSSRGINMYDNLAAVSRQLVLQKKKPAAVIIAGDCAYLSGLKEDYANLLKLVEPVRTAGMPVHLLLGNHDNRENVLAALPARQKRSPVDDKLASLVPSQTANWYLLDSLIRPNYTPGQLGDKQLAWLEKSLDENKDKPAIVGVHHNPFRHKTALLDQDALFKVLAPRKQVKAVFYGHTHDWRLSEREGIHLINLPPVGYVFRKGKPSGWIDAQLTERGASLRLVCHDVEHPQHDKTAALKWRA